MNANWLNQAARQPDRAAQEAAERRQQQLTKPPGSLGQLERLAVRLAGLQGREFPQAERVTITLFAADHGVAAEGVSAFPQAVTAEMVRNFARGGAAISVLARQLGARLEVVNLGTVSELESLSGVIDARIGAGTANFCHGPAMTTAQLEQALAQGRAAVQRALADEAELFIAGDMGIANTTAATALACVLLQRPAAELAGPGTGLDAHGVQHKARLIEQAIARHGASADQPLRALQCLGGFEIAAMAGAYVHCAQQGLPALVDGFIATAAALMAVSLQPGTRHWLLLAHASAEPGHRAMLQALKAHPLLDLDLRLGEGSGAALAVPLLRAACALHQQMATFAEAGVSEG